ncbi:hypothetical protein Pan241w_07960 [Gimesia alba]|uniref:Uncharacterized protein n=1 Tax=Gimesia alba TaxID=2527973 RepID=A0A517RA45_9PLAN|nr:hypothetical protein [Gimesia alba]QDT40738.1 hypothetical protein Pan241w_07960 [Gimesia alba]
MKFHIHRRTLTLILIVFFVLNVPTVGQAGEEVLFQLARSLLNEKTGTGEKVPAFRRKQVLEALARLRLEKELEYWPAKNPVEAKNRLSICWENGLYWAGLSYAQESGLSLSQKLASLAGHGESPPERLITQLLAQETKPVQPLDQSMVSLMRFAARYNQALRSENREAELNNLVPVAIELAPQALQLLETSYPPDKFYILLYHPVKSEVAQCTLAMLTLVPVDQRPPELCTLSLQVELMFGLSCIRRGWTSAFNTGIDLLAKKDESMALMLWQSGFLTDPEMVRNSSLLLLPESHKAAPKLHHFVAGVNSCLNLLRTQTYQKSPEALSKLLQEPESELWRFCVLLSLETARLRADRKLLQLASRSLLEQSDRLYSFKREEDENMAEDLRCLYYSAFRAAKRVNDSKLQQKLLERILSIDPDIDGTYHNVLTIHHTDISDWSQLLSDAAIDPKWLKKYEEISLNTFEKYLFGQYEIGMLWATTAQSEINGKQILTMYRKCSDLNTLARGAGFAAGRGCALLSVGATWLNLCQSAPRYNSVECFIEYCEGYTEGKQSSRSDWDTRLLQVLNQK